MSPIHRWNGRYFGFVLNGNLFDAKANYVGWVTNGVAWHADGTYLGELHLGSYVLRPTAAAPPPRQPPRSYPARLAVPSAWSDRPAQPRLEGFADALDAFPDA